MYLFLGILLVGLGVFCFVMVVSKRAHDPAIAVIGGFLVTALGVILLLSVFLKENESLMYGSGFLVFAVLCFALDIMRNLHMRRCVQPCEGEFCGVINCEALGILLNRPFGKAARYSRFFHVDSAVFRYWVQGEERLQSVLDYRFRLFFQTSRFLRQYEEGKKYTIYIDPDNPASLVTAPKRFQAGLLSLIGVLSVILAFAFLRPR